MEIEDINRIRGRSRRTKGMNWKREREVYEEIDRKGENGNKNGHER